MLRDPLTIVDVTAFVDALATAPNVTTIFAARHEPPLPWRDWAAAGRLIRIGWEELALDRAQVAAIFAEHDSTLTDEDLDAVHALTQGWAALVRIAAIYLRSPHDRRGAVAELLRSPHPVSDHLVDGLLATLPSSLVTFLLATSIVDTFTVELAEHLTDQRAGEVLAVLENFGLPILHSCATDTAPVTHTYHPLLRAHLRAEVHRRDPTWERQLHAAAAEWFVGTGAVVEALTHLVGARDVGAVSALVHRRGLGTVLGPHAHEALDLLDGIGATDWRIVRVLHALAALERGTPTAACAYLDTLPDSDAEGADHQIETILVVAVGAAITLECGQSVDPVSIRTLDEAPATGILDVDCYVLLVRATHHMRCGCSETDELVGRATALAELAGHHSLQLRCTLVAATASGLGGDVTEMSTRALAAADFAADHDLLDTSDAHTGAVLAALALYLQGDSLPPASAAARLLHATDPGVADAASVPLPCRQSRLILDLHQFSGPTTPSETTVAAAVANVDLVLAEAADRNDGTDLVPLFVAALLRFGRLAEAEHVYRHMQHRDKSFLETRLIAAMIAHARQQHHTVRTILAPIMIEPPAAPDSWVRVLLLDALAARGLRNSESMQRSIHRALAFAAPQNLLRPFLDNGLEIAALLSDVVPTVGSTDRFVDHVRRRLVAEIAVPTPALTAAERLVLAQLPSGRTAEEIGRQLSVSVNTVKTHLRNLYRKLEVTSRGAAISAALRTGLL
ncbi:LuxR C-terminal-related transcriptional regulator [Rhodococcus sp. C26F]